MSWQIDNEILFQSTDTVLKMMQQSLTFVQQMKQQNNNYPVITFSTEMASFYEWTDWKRIKSSKYIALRNGDHGKILTSSIVDVNWINFELGFNQNANKAIPLDRILSDFRPNLCKNWHYLPQALPNVSIIIFFVEEDFRILLRTVYSVLLNTPRNLLNEIILVIDNASGGKTQQFEEIIKQIKNSIRNNSDQIDKFLFDKFVNYSHRMPYQFGEMFDLEKIRLVTTKRRSGLGVALNLAISKATGKVLIFLKSCVEVTHNWLPPLLAPIIEDSNTITIPNFIKVKPNAFGYDDFKNGNLDLIYWNWGLFTKSSTTTLQKINDQYEYLVTLPYRLNILSSLQFAISAEFIREIGFFDRKYLILNEINMDLSFKILHCKGIIKVPCSQIFSLEKTIKNRIIELFDEIFIENNYQFEPACLIKTIAQKWIPQAYISNFYKLRPSLYGDLCQNVTNCFETDNINVPSEKCSNPEEVFNNLVKSERMKFFILSKNVLPVIVKNTFYGETPANTLIWGEIMNVHYAICLNVETSRNEEDILEVQSVYCHTKYTAKVFQLDSVGMLKIDNYCLYPSPVKDNISPMEAVNCFLLDSSKNQIKKWQYTEEGLFHFGVNFCLTFTESYGIILAQCSEHYDSSQQWQWITG